MPYHIEIASPVDRVRAFNLDPADLSGGVLEGWLVGLPFEFDERRWDPRESRLTILEGPAVEVAGDDGWEIALRAAEDVTRSTLEAVETSAPAQAALVVEADSAAAALKQLQAGGAAEQIPWATAVERLQRRDPDVTAVILVVRRSPLSWPRL